MPLVRLPKVFRLQPHLQLRIQLRRQQLPQLIMEVIASWVLLEIDTSPCGVAPRVARPDMTKTETNRAARCWRRIYALTDAYRDFRSFIRNLDIPFASAQQRKFVDAIQDYVDALNRYLESDGKDLSVNDYLIPLSDAESDFNNAFLGTCQR